MRPLAAPRDDSGLRQQSEVLGDILLRGAEVGGQLVHARLAVPQAVEQPDAHRLSDHAKAAGDQLDERVWKRIGQ